MYSVGAYVSLNRAWVFAAKILGDANLIWIHMQVRRIVNREHQSLSQSKALRLQRCSLSIVGPREIDGTRSQDRSHSGLSHFQGA